MPSLENEQYRARSFNDTINADDLSLQMHIFNIAVPESQRLAFLFRIIKYFNAPTPDLNLLQALNWDQQ